MSGEWYSSYQLVSGSNAADFFGFEDKDKDLLCAQDTSLSGKLARHWKLRVMAQEAALKEAATAGLGACWRKTSPPTLQLKDWRYVALLQTDAWGEHAAAGGPSEESGY